MRQQLGILYGGLAGLAHWETLQAISEAEKDWHMLRSDTSGIVSCHTGLMTRGTVWCADHPHGQ